MSAVRVDILMGVGREVARSPHRTCSTDSHHVQTPNTMVFVASLALRRIFLNGFGQPYPQADSSYEYSSDVIHIAIFVCVVSNILR